MLPTPCPPVPALPLGLPFVELFGGLCLAQADMAQRLQYLACRLSVGVSESWLRNHMLKGDDIVCAADRAELGERVALLLEAGTEGWVTILRGYIEEFAQAQVRCVEAALDGVVAGRPAVLLPFMPGGALAAVRVDRLAALSAEG